MSHDLGTIIAALHDSEINGEVSWFFDGVWHVKLGDDANGFVAKAVVSSPGEAGEWLRARTMSVSRLPGTSELAASRSATAGSTPRRQLGRLKTPPAEIE